MSMTSSRPLLRSNVTLRSCKHSGGEDPICSPIRLENQRRRSTRREMVFRMPKTSRRSFLQSAPVLGAASWLETATVCKLARASGRLTPKSSELRAAAFSCNVTPPIGSPLEECHPPVATSVESPLLAKGVVLSDGETRYALCAFDYCELRSGGHDLFRRKIADAIEVNELQVEVHCIHQHDAPLYDVDAELIMSMVPSPPRIANLDFLQTASDRVAAAAREAMGQLEPWTAVGFGKARVEKFASNRRVPMPDGSIGVRYSSCTDPVLTAAPEGLIDPWMRTITLFNGERPIVRLHYYASHPQSYYGQGHINPDTPGIARERLEKEERIPQIYFTGCAGNIAAGKYNDGSPAARVQLADRLYQGMKGAIAATQTERCTEITRKASLVRFALRTDTNFSEAHFREALVDPNQPYQERTKSATGLAWYARLKVRPSVDLSCYQFGPVRILHLPGEAFIEYQLYAESLCPNNFLAAAAYGELGTGYICTEKAFAQGGYEPTQSFVAPESEARLKAAIHELLA